MAFVERVSYSGGSSTSTLGGQIRLDDTRGTLTVRDPSTNQVVTLVDRFGFKVNDILGREMTRIDTLGVTTTEPSTGIERNRFGIARDNGRTIVATTKPGVDLRTLGI